MRSFLPRILLLLLLSACLPARAQRCAWVQSVPGAHAQSGLYAPRQLGLDAAGNAYVIGQLTQRLILGPDTLQVHDTLPGAASDVFLAKYTPAGQVVWAVQLASPGADTAFAVVADAAGNTFVAGSSAPGLNLGVVGTAPLQLNRAGCWLARISPAGVPQWLQYVAPAGAGRSTVPVVTIDGIGSVYLAVNSRDLDSVGTMPLVNTVGNVSVVARCSASDGRVTAVQEFNASAGQARISDVAASPSGGVFCTGYFRQQVGFGPDPAHVLTTNDSVAMFVARLSPALQTDWVRTNQLGRGNVVLGLSLALSAADEPYVAGWAWQRVRLGTGVESLSGGAFVAKYDARGYARWLRAQGGPRTGVDSPRGIVVDADGNAYTTGVYQSTGFQFGVLTLPAAGPGVARPYILKHDATGRAQWLRNGQLSHPSQEVCWQGLALDPAGGLVLYGQQHTAPAQPAAPCTLAFDQATAVGPGLFLARFAAATQAQGEVYLDQNADGYRGASEPAFPRPVVVTDGVGGYVGTSDALRGDYTLFANGGDYDLAATVPLYYRLAQGYGGYQGTFAPSGLAATNKSFGLVAVPNQADVRVTLTPYSGLRPGRPQRYRARVENVGTTTVAQGQVVVSLGGAVTIIGTLPTANSGVGNLRSWEFYNLPPLAVREYDVVFNIPIATPVGTPYQSTAAMILANDNTPFDNLDTLQQAVIASFDPNDITVNHAHLTPSQVAAATPLDYLVRFENLGTDTAFSVIVVDSLPASQLQLGTLQLVGSSHNCQWMVTGRGVLTMRFPNIRLPYQRIDALRSQGFVRFQVRPRTSLTEGTIIPAIAHITFDFNPPIATNQVTTLVGAPNAAPALLAAETGAWALYPNPVAGARAVVLAAEIAAPGRLAVTVADALGRTVLTRTTPVAPGALRLPLQLPGATAAGIYSVRLTLPGHPPTVQRLLVQP